MNHHIRCEMTSEGIRQAHFRGKPGTVGARSQNINRDIATFTGNGSYQTRGIFYREILLQFLYLPRKLFIDDHWISA